MARLTLLRWPKSRPWRFSLRALLILITLGCIWAGFHAGPAWKERRIAAIFERHNTQWGRAGIPGSEQDLGWKIAYHYKQVVRLIWGQQYIETVYVRSKIEPELVEAIAAVPGLKTLSLLPSKLPAGSWHQHEDAVPLPPGALARILANHQLKSLYIAGFSLSDEDCSAICAHTSLEGLAICGTSLSEDSLARLVTLPHLRGLVLERNARIEGFGLKSVQGSTALETIGCKDTPLGHEFAAYVARCPNVTTLDLGHPSVDDEFVLQLAGHPRLCQAYLAKCGLTDAVLPAIQEMPALRIVSFPKSVSKNGIAQLKGARPDIHAYVLP